MLTEIRRVAFCVGLTLLGVMVVLVGLHHSATEAVGSDPPAPEPTPVPDRFAALLNPTTLPVEERQMLAFYYPWYHMPDWSSPQMLDTPLVPYSSGDPAAIARHVTWAQDAGLDGFVVSWWGRYVPYVDNNLTQVLDEMAGTDLKAAIYFETYSPYYTQTVQIIDEMEYALDTHATHPNYLTHEGRPVVFIFAVRHVPRSGGASAFQTWVSILNQLHADGYSPFIVGDELNPQYLQIFDGLHPYLAIEDVDFYQNIACQTHQVGRLWAAGTYPGYDDHLLPGRVPRIIPRNSGQTYENTFEAALQTDPDWVLVTSFNEWWENTHIEPSVQDGHFYLTQTARLAAEFHSWRALPTVYVDATHVGFEDGSATNPFNTVQEAVRAASEGATVKVAGGVYQGPITLTHSINIQGGYQAPGWTRDTTANPTVLQGEGNGSVLYVHANFCSSPPVVVDGFTITGGSATGVRASGGGVHVQNAYLLLANSTITANQAQEKGGGIFVEGVSQLTLRESRILGNTANSGGALFVTDQSQLEMTNTLVAQNQTALAGGGVYLGPDVSASIINSTMADNRAGWDGNNLHGSPLATNAIDLINNIVWDGNGDPPVENGADNVVCRRNCSVTYSDVAGGWQGAGNLQADPLFRDPAHGDYHLRPDSPVIGAGDPAGVQPTGPAPSIDLDSEPRPLGSRVDVGIDEVSPLAPSTITVNKTVALPGDTLAYTLTLASDGTTLASSAQVTITLPLITQYVTGSLQASAGVATYVPPGGTLLQPSILWTGIVTPGQAVRVHYALALPNDPTFLCATAANEAAIASHSVRAKRRADTRISTGVLDHIETSDAPGPAGTTVVDRTLAIGDELAVYAAAYDDCPGYLNPAIVNWQTSGSLEYGAGVGDSFTFAPTHKEGTGRITADDGLGHYAETGLLTVQYAAPKIAVSPTSLISVQSPQQQVTKALTVSNAHALTLTFELITTTRPFEVNFAWKDNFAIGTDFARWDYYATPESVDARLARAEVSVTEVEIETAGTNLAQWIHWDWEAHLSNQAIGLPEGQMERSTIDPWQGYPRNAPVQFLVSIGEVNQPNSYVYQANHDFVTGSTSVSPFYKTVKRSSRAPMQLTDGLHAQVLFWTGDARSEIQFNDVKLTVRGVVTFTAADWLTVSPSKGTLGPNANLVLNASFLSGDDSIGHATASIALATNDPDRALVAIPATMRVIGTLQVFLPVTPKNH